MDNKRIIEIAKMIFNKIPLSLWLKRRIRGFYYNYCSSKNISNEVWHNLLKESNANFKRVIFDKDKYILDLFCRTTQKPPDFVPIMEQNISLQENDVKVIAFYLPQFHPIPENDAWHGKGFTEWTNVTNTIPQFVGHYQPHLPGDLGFYDLRLIDVQKQQIELAKKYGIYGFCYYYYWFSGKRLLEQPLEQMLKNPELDFPFCIFWANQSWTRRWHGLGEGLEEEVLIEQKYSPEDDIAFIEDIEPALKDSRYIKIHGKPILIVYFATSLPDAKATTERWREYCRDAGIGELYLAMIKENVELNPKDYGFDAVVEFSPKSVNMPRVTSKVEMINPEAKLDIYDFNAYVKSKCYIDKPNYKLLKSVFPSWDNTARNPRTGKIYFGTTPSAYKEFLTDIVQYTKQNNVPEEQVVFINAWNEWAEGAHLEPDRKYGYAYLQATAEVILKNRKDI